MAGKKDRQFVETLRDLGYNCADKLVEADFEWMFDDPDTCNFLDWFCDNVSEHNVLRDDEIKEFKSMEANGDIIISDPHELETALCNLHITNEGNVSLSDLRTEVSDLQNEYQRLDKQQTSLIEQREILSAYHNELKQKLSKLKTLEHQENQKLMKIIDQCHQHNSQMNECLQKLSKSVTELTAIYAHSGLMRNVDKTLGERGEATLGDCETGRRGSPSVFLSEIALSRFHAMEERFTQKLTEYSKKQFFEGIADVVTEKGEPTRYEILEINNPAHVLIKGEQENVIKSDCKELTELQKIYPVSESQYITSLVKLNGMEAAVRCAQQKVQILQEKAISRSYEELNKKTMTAETELKQVRSETKSMEDNVIPQFLQETSKNQCAMVLTGDYDLKIARQEYFISKQDAVIDQLICQRSRSEFLLMGLALEEEKHKEMHTMLTALGNVLGEIIKSFTYRMEVMSQFKKDQPKRATIDSRDESMVRLHKILVDTGESDVHRPQLFSTYASLVDSARQHEKNLADHVTVETKVTDENKNEISMLEKGVQKGVKAVIQKPGDVESDSVSLNANSVITCASQLTQTLHNLEKSLLEVLKDCSHKKKILEEDQYQATERDLFIHFFTNPDKLSHEVTHLEQQVDALKKISKMK